VVVLAYRADGANTENRNSAHAEIHSVERVLTEMKLRPVSFGMELCLGEYTDFSPFAENVWTLSRQCVKYSSSSAGQSDGMM
jgi:hypothetical protein